jgi:integrase
LASIQRLRSAITGRVSFRVQVRRRGFRSQSATFPVRGEAKRWATHVEARIRRERYAVLTPFANVVERYRKEVLPDFAEPARSSRELHLTWWTRRFGNLGLAAVNQVEIAKARDALALEKPLSGHRWTHGRRRRKTYPSRHTHSPATVNRYLSSLSHLFTVAMHEWNLVERHPVREVKRHAEPLGRARFLTDRERRQLLPQCKRSRWHQLHFLVLLAISTGARRSELIKLKWSDITLSARRPEIHVSESKNGDARFLPLIGHTLAIVRAMKRRHPPVNSYVFPARNGGDGPYRGFDKHWYEALAAAGIEDFRFHDLRHTCASYLAGDGASLLEIADVLGHRSLRMTLRYAHLGTGHKRARLARMVQGRGL